MKSKTTRKFFVEHSDGRSWVRRYFAFPSKSAAIGWFRRWRMGNMEIQGRIIEVIEKIHKV